MPDPKHTGNQKDNWDKFEIFAKGILAIFIPVALTIYGIYSERQRMSESELNRATQVLVQALSNREAVGGDLKAKMFATLMEYYFKGQPEARIAILELMAMNFKDQFQLRPLFEKLDAELTSTKEKEDLRRVAKNISSKEIGRIVGAGGSVCEFKWKKKTKIDDSSSCNIPLSLALLNVEDDRVLVSRTPPGGEDSIEINYFDMPSADNTKIGELTYALVLSDANKTNESAKVKLVVFPRHYYSAENRLQLDQMMGQYLERQEK